MAKRPRKPVEAKPTPEDEAAKKKARLWASRLTRADRTYKNWSDEYECDGLARYYQGKQWRGLSEELRKKKYVINMIFATIETQLPSLMFSRPKVSVEPRPARAQEPGSDSSGRATLMESTLQTFVDNRDLHFTFETTLALRDAYARFGIVEVGYTADYIDNPNADKPVLKDNSEDPLLDNLDQPVTQPKKIQKDESLFLKRVPAKQFRVWPGRNQLLANDWCAYYEFQNVEDVKANPQYQNTANLKSGGTTAQDAEEQTTDDTERLKHSDQVKLWKLWDLRTKTRYVIAEGHDLILQEKRYTYLPLAAMKFYEDEDAWYPVPPIFNWLSPQDEINETREMQKVHRRRGLRRYMREPGVSKTEFEKLETGEDMVCIEVPKTTPPMIVPIQDADISRQNSVEELALAKDDFNQVAGVSGEARGIPQSDTATQANIINVREQIRESRARTQVAEWLGEIVRLMMLTIKEKMQLPMAVRMNTDPFAPPRVAPPAAGSANPPAAGAQVPTAVARTAVEWQTIEKEKLGEMDYDVKIDIASLSPVAEDGQRQQWNIVLQLLTNQQLATLLFMPNPEAPDEPSPMLRKTLWLNGVKNDSEVREIWRIGQAVLKAQAMAAAASSQQQPDQPKISYSFKGDDMSDPMIRLAFLRAEMLVAEAAAAAKQGQQNQPQVPPADESAGGIAPLAKALPAPVTGTPAPGPAAAG